MPIRRQLADAFREKRVQPTFWLQLTLFGFLALAFWPITRWLAENAQDQTRLLHALIILGAASVLLIRFNRVEISRPLHLNRQARNALCAAYALLAGALLGPVLGGGNAAAAFLNLLNIPAYCLALAAFVLFVFGDKVTRLTWTVTGTFCLFLFFSVAMNPLDWPLRTIAGEWSAWFLDLLGRSVELGLLNKAGEPPKLILMVEDHPFHVASECNGFGVILTSLLIAFLLSVYRKAGFLDTALNLAAGVFLGFIFNLLRIVVIVLLAPYLMEHYMLMHEIVGTITYWTCLVALWLLLKGPTEPEIPSATDAPATGHA